MAKRYAILQWLATVAGAILAGLAVWFATENLKDPVLLPRGDPSPQDTEWKRTAGRYLNNLQIQTPSIVDNWDVALSLSGKQCERAQVALFETRKYAVSERFRATKDDYESAMKEICAAHTQLQFHNVEGWKQHWQEAVTHFRAMRGVFADNTY